MKVCITGSSGFIGSNLTEECLRKGWHVVGVDDLSVGRREMSEPNRYRDLPGKYVFNKIDICDTKNLTQAMDGCSIVFHLAAKARVPFSIDFPLEAHQTNATGHLSVLEAAKNIQAKRVVFACSSSIFGGTNIHPTPETAPRKPLSPYALQKHYGAELNRLYYELHGLDSISLIYYNVYGPLQFTGGAYSTIIPAFMEAAVNGKSCRVDGDGNQSRDFTMVSDVVNANILAAEYEGIFKGEAFNIACGESHSVNEVYELVDEFFGNVVEKHYAPRRPGDPIKSMADVGKAKEILGYETKVKFVDGIQKTASWWANGCSVNIGD